MSADGDITGLLHRWRDGDEAAMNELSPLVHDRLQQLAHSAFRNEYAAQTLQPTAVVNEAWLQLAGAQPAVENRGHFYALAARMMRRILVNHAHARNAQKRGGDQLRVTLDLAAVNEDTQDSDVLELHEALDALATHDSHLEELLELHYFGGFTAAEIAEALDVSESTAKRQMRFARAWVRRYLDTA
ncbi:ECF-type sigma factor [Marinihelvus fidelis]|uniref:ECF-type sigma factor n=1 Tax=Marinihelvus fidelis TaxID=2613842 RepID=UPI0017822048|nr:ECF-type sigma factor [Marinihelvus fidelis]